MSRSLRPGTVVRRPSPRAAWAGGALLVGVLAQLWLGTAGQWADSGLTYFYQEMANGFRAGHLYLDRVPPSDLLKSPNPFGLEQGNLWIWDTSLSNGHFYHYFGPIPALGLLALETVRGERLPFSDQWPTVFLGVLRCVAIAFVIGEMRRQIWRRAPATLEAALVLFATTLHPGPFAVARPHAYEAAIIGEQAFLMLGLGCLAAGMRMGRYRLAFWAAASVSWGLALGCRVTAALALPGLFVAALVWLYLEDAERAVATKVRAALWLAAPMTGAALAQAVYNHERFGSFSEFGLGCQLTGMPFWTHVRYVLPNLYSYFALPPEWSREFPFVLARAGFSVPDPISAPGYLTSERTVGMLWVAPLIGLCWPSPLGSWRDRRQTVARWSESCETGHSAYWWLCGAVIALPMAPALGMWVPIARYSLDATGGLIVLVVWRVLRLARDLSWRPRALRAWCAGAVVLALIGSASGVLVAYTNNHPTLTERNPQLSNSP